MANGQPDPWRFFALALQVIGCGLIVAGVVKTVSTGAGIITAGLLAICIGALIERDSNGNGR